jgi:predicted nucleic acid-binding protein
MRVALDSNVLITPDVMRDALEFSSAHHLQIGDAVVLTAAADAGCALLPSEDFQHGFAWRGVTVRNYLATPL